MMRASALVLKCCSAAGFSSPLFAPVPRPSEFVPESQAKISVLDHAVLYGDGIFEAAFAWNGRIFKLDAHVDRAFRSMAAIALPAPASRDEFRRCGIGVSIRGPARMEIAINRTIQCGE
jgi:branched-subunit amino acid aminotransferase/4-amino-4-deoxychorismate lyase